MLIINISGEKFSVFQTKAKLYRLVELGKVFSILSVELNVIQSPDWDANWVIVFQSVILQCVQLATGAKNIHA